MLSDRGAASRRLEAASAACAPGAVGPPPQVLLYDNSGRAGEPLLGHLRQLGLKFVALVGSERPLAAGEVDLLAVRLVGAECGGLAYAAEVASATPWVQCVFWADDDGLSPGRDAARSLGVARLLSTPQILAWLPLALEPLARLARARRIAQEALAAVPPVAEPPDAGGAPALPLPEAERRFRESYLRFLLSATPNARRAAERAGVPYTTLCSMLKKLGLTRSEPRR